MGLVIFDHSLDLFVFMNTFHMFTHNRPLLFVCKKNNKGLHKETIVSFVTFNRDYACKADSDMQCVVQCLFQPCCETGGTSLLSCYFCQ